MLTVMRRAVIAAVLLAALALTSSAQAAPRQERAAPGEPGLPGPQIALQRALAYFMPSEARRSFRSAAKSDPRGATIALRDLAAVLDPLSGADRRLAAEILARPTDLGSGNYTAPKAVD
jgi:hypothetical protein